MTDSNINSLLNNEEEKDETLLDTTQIKSNTESLLDRIEQKSFTPNLDQNIFKTQAKVVDFFDNKFLMKPVATAEREARLYKQYRSQGMDSYKAYLKSRS